MTNDVLMNHNIKYDYIDQNVIDSIPETICLVDLFPKTVFITGFPYFIEKWISDVNIKYPNANLRLVK